MSGRLDWEKANREARARKNGTLSIYPETRSRKRKPKRQKVKQSRHKSARVLEQLRRLLRIVATSKWEHNGAKYQQELARQMRALSEKVVRLKPSLSKNADVLRARELSGDVFDRSAMSVDAATDGLQQTSPVPSGEGLGGSSVSLADQSSKVPRTNAGKTRESDDSQQLAEPKDEKMVRYLATLIAERQGMPLDDAMLIAAAEQGQKEEELKLAKKRSRKGVYGAKSPGWRKKKRSSQRIIYTTPGNVRLVSGGLPSLGKRK